jgi:hypothetical protein
VNAPCNMLTRKPEAGNPHVRFDEGEDSLPDPLYSASSFLRWALSAFPTNLIAFTRD